MPMLISRFADPDKALKTHTTEMYGSLLADGGTRTKYQINRPYNNVFMNCQCMHIHMYVC